MLNVAQVNKCNTLYGRMVCKINKISKAGFYVVDSSLINRYDIPSRVNYNIKATRVALWSKTQLIRIFIKIFFLCLGPLVYTLAGFVPGKQKKTYFWHLFQVGKMVTDTTSDL